MQNKELNFDDGLINFNVNGKCNIIFNPADGEFVKKLYDAFVSAQEAYDKEQSEIEKLGENKEKIFEISEKCADDIKKTIDGIFGPISEKLFDSVGVMAFSNGLPMFLNFFLALLDTIDSATVEEMKLTNPRVEKYTAKYAKYTKYHK